MLLPASSGPPFFSYKGSSSGGFIDHKRKGLEWGREKINGLWASLGRTETCFSQKKQKGMELSGNIREKNVHFCFRRDLAHRSIDGFEIWARFELPRVRKSGFRIPECRKILLVEFGIPGFGMRNTSQGIRNPTNDWNWVQNPNSSDKNGDAFPGTRNPRCGIQNSGLSWIP